MLSRLFHSDQDTGANSRARRGLGLALAGGGCKAFFALGAGKVLFNSKLPIAALAGTSAGSAMALSLVCDVADELVDYFSSVTLRNEKNFYLSNLLKGKRPFPHERMYRWTIRSLLDIDKIKASRIEMAFNSLLLPPSSFPLKNRWKRLQLIKRLATAYRNEEIRSARFDYGHEMRRVVEEAGLQEVVFHQADLTSISRVENIVMASSSVPPMVRFQQMEDGNYYLDGGAYRNLPVYHLPDVDLVIAIYYQEVSRKLLELDGENQGRNIIYIAPDTELPITTWDYANPAGIRRAYQLGQQAAERLMPQIESTYKKIRRNRWAS